MCDISGQFPGNKIFVQHQKHYDVTVFTVIIVKDHFDVYLALGNFLCQHKFNVFVLLVYAQGSCPKIIWPLRFNVQITEMEMK